MSEKNKEHLELIEQLVENVLQTVQTLQYTVELTERYYDNSHSRYVGNTSAAIAKLLNLSDEKIFVVKTAGYLHDIGKIGFRDSALFRPTSEMTARELKQYKLHVDIGRELLSNHNELEEISEIVYQHHELYDGTGFPNRLRKNDIHIGARIISAVDYYHNAMFKTYIKGTTEPNDEFSIDIDLKYDGIIKQLEYKSGIKFDPNVINVFLKIIEAERNNLKGSDVQRVHISNIKPGMIFAENYYNQSGLLLANKGDKVEHNDIKFLYRCIESNQLPSKLLMLTKTEYE